MGIAHGDDVADLPQGAVMENSMGVEMGLEIVWGFVGVIAAILGTGIALAMNQRARLNELNAQHERRFNDLMIALGTRLDDMNMRISDMNTRISDMNTRMNELQSDVGRRLEDMKQDLREIRAPFFSQVPAQFPAQSAKSSQYLGSEGARRQGKKAP